MYTNDRGSRINWIDIVVKIVFAGIFILILMWLFGRLEDKIPNLDSLFSNQFRENISFMQNAGRSYFTNERLPKKVGETNKITLAEMFDKNLILPFVDKDGNSCNQYESYVSVEKAQNEYVLKINLVCNNESNHIIEILGCYDYCDKKVPEVKTVKEYQFKKPATKTSTTYSCPKGYSRSGKYCYKNITGSEFGATKLYYDDTTQVTDASKKTGASTNQYVDYIKTTGETVYDCASGYTKSGSGANTQCTIYSSGNSETYCPNGGYASGNQCVITTSVVTTTVVTGSTCPSGYSLYGSTCRKLVTSTTTSGGSTIAGTPKQSCSVEVYTSPKSGTGYQWLDTYPVYCPTCSGGTRMMYKYNVCTTSYTCPSGYTQSGTNCVKSGTSSTTESYVYANPTNTTSTVTTCPSGYPNKSGNQCWAYTAGSQRLVCPSGYTSNGSTCYKTIAATKYEGTTTYTCPNGYTKSGSGTSTKCYKVVAGTTTYYCSNTSAKLVGQKCYLDVKGGFKGYSCPSGYKLNGSMCYKTTTEKVEATVKKSTKEVYSYKWSTKTFISGWTPTGKSRTVGGGSSTSTAKCSATATCVCN